MPTYDYQCETNAEVVEVSHGMGEKLATWGELCDRAGRALGNTSADAPVHRLITGGTLVHKASLGSGQAPPCETGAPCCAGQVCGLN